MTTLASEKAKPVRLLIVDIDGVLTDGGLHFDNRGEEYKTFNSLDGHGIRMMLECGIEVAVITGRQSKIVNHRMGDLGVRHIYQGNRDKLPAFEQLLQDTGIEASQAAYIGDDLPDLPIMQRVGFTVAVQNAHGFVKQHCDLVTTAYGGHGAVREVTDFILHAQGLLEDRQNSYLK
ncbi:MAG: 3-deoxy-manno-octulosonate-8-phosphatase KdsC [Gammaproteobacteria bacterium]|nr:MAG: 3-deoxy-manno-octulosonate-8-phosphatase KdsC [Gammaproteobacteria bacterium]UCH39892.1 MAG: 3-deoxy-manno-octulosonate-8-phosphatase KdsC [Gammaproteobacteria bacterium]